MKLLKQKYHGLPGLGVNGKTGETGANGESIFIGNINEFFDGEHINIKPYVYLAKRILSDEINEEIINNSLQAAWDITQAEMLQYLTDEHILYTNVLDSSNDPSSYINYKTLYYSGTKLSDSSIVTNLNLTNEQINNGKIVEFDLNGDYISMSYMLKTADISANLDESQDIPEFVQYNTQYDYGVQSGLLNSSLILSDTYYNILSKMTHYEFGDEAALIIGNASAGFQTSNIQYDINDAIYAVSSSAGEAMEKGELLDNQSFDTYYYQYPENSGITYVKENISIPGTQNEYITNINNVYKGFLNANSYIYKEIGNGKNVYLDENGGEDITSKWNLFYKTSGVLNANQSIYYEKGQLVDSDNFAFYGIPNSSLYIDRNNSELNTSVNVLGTNYIENILKNGNQSYAQCLIRTPNGKVFYSLDETATILYVPTTLKESFKAGDVLYFYVNQSEFQYNLDIMYMVSLTEEMLGCTPSQLISYAIKVEPFKIDIFKEINGRVRNYENIATIYNPSANIDPTLDDGQKDIISNTGLASIADKYTNAPIILGSNKTFAQCNAAIFYKYGDVEKYKLLCCKENENTIINSAKPLKINTLAVNQNIISDITNVELSKNVYSTNIIFVDKNFIKPLTDIDLYFDKTNEYSSVFIKQINGSDYFYNIKNLNNYYYGCDIYNKNMEKIKTITSSDETFDIELIPEINNDTYYIQMFASCGTSLKYYSKITKLNITYSKFLYNENNMKIKYSSPIGRYSKGKEYHTTIGEYTERYQITSYSLNILGENQNITKDYKSGNIIFDLSDITSNKIENASLNVYTEDASIIIDDVLFNHINNFRYDTIIINNTYNAEPDPDQEQDIHIQDLDFEHAEYYKCNVYDDMLEWNGNSYYVWHRITTEGEDLHIVDKYYSNDYEEGAILTDTLDLDVRQFPFNSSCSGFVASITNDSDHSIYYNLPIEKLKGDNRKAYGGKGLNALQKYNGDILCESIWKVDNVINHEIYETEINCNNWSIITLDSSASNSKKYNLNFDSNISKFNSSSFDNINQYVISGANTNTNYGIEECKLFKNILNNRIVEPTKPRSIQVTAKYHYIGDESDTYCENFYIVQPGFTDTRNVPNIELNAHLSMSELESENTIENNITTNQFVTYLDINIKDFKDQWGQFANNDTNIILNCSISNIEYDIDWQSKYIIQNLIERRTFRSITEQDATHLNNYVKIIPTLIENDNNVLYEGSDGSLNSIPGATYKITNNIVYCNQTSSYNASLNDNYILCDSSFMNATQYPNIINCGIQDNVMLELKNIPITDDIDNIKLKLLIEMGNPMLANIYFRFAVTNLTIDVNINDEVYHFNTLVPDKNSIAEDTYLTNIGSLSQTEQSAITKIQYTYISKPIDITFNPISYIMCPADAEESYTNIYGDIYKYGVKEQIQKSLCFFNSSAYISDNEYFNYTSSDVRDKSYYPLNNILIKKSYIQDNIKSINVKPISLYDSINQQLDNSESTYIDSSIKEHNVLDFIEGNKYLSIAYHSTLMQPRIRNNSYTFYYNDNEYERSRYDQKINNLPIFAYDEAVIELRDDELISSMDKWNDYYAEYAQYKDAKTFNGVLSLYGNGYTQILPESAQNSSINIYNDLTLEETVEKNSHIINIEKNTYEINIEPFKNTDPKNGEYFRGFLYDINWEFPYYDKTDIIPYRIVSSFDNYLKNISDSSTQSIPETYQEYYNALTDSSLYETRMVPYTLLFDINPRIAYNYENDTINVLMLRKPSIGQDTDNINNADEFKQKYEFNRRLFNLTKFEKLKSPYLINLN